MNAITLHLAIYGLTAVLWKEMNTYLAIYGFKATIHGKFLKSCGVVVKNKYCYYSFSHI